MTQHREDTTDYARVFLADAPLMDTRAPLEFARGAFPSALSLPLMTDEERAAVGTCYKQKGQEAAITLGHELVAGEVRDSRMEAWRRFAEANPNGYLYCFRGGLRSQIVQNWLAEVGVSYPRIGGGYKAMRRFLLDTLEAQAKRADIYLIAGATGTGKTRLVNALSRSIDLEALARHRGSAFGRLLVEQPSQIDFENALAIALLKLAQTPGPVFLEDEGRLIGRLAVPENLRKRMASAPLLVLDYSVDERVQVVIEDYIIDLGERFRSAHGVDGPLLHRQRLQSDLARTRKRLGGERFAAIGRSMDAAFNAQERSGSIEGHRAWIRDLLTQYYDPMYAYQLSRRDGQRLHAGTREELAAWIKAEIRHAD